MCPYIDPPQVMYNMTLYQNFRQFSQSSHSQCSSLLLHPIYQPSMSIQWLLNIQYQGTSKTMFLIFCFSLFKHDLFWFWTEIGKQFHKNALNPLYVIEISFHPILERRKKKQFGKLALYWYYYTTYKKWTIYITSLFSNEIITFKI